MTKFLVLAASFILAGFLAPVAHAQNGRQRHLLDSNWRFHVNELSGAAATINQTSLTQWVWIADNNAPSDAAVMAAQGLDTSAWASVTLGTDVFGGRVGYAWYRTTITNLASMVRPLSLSFLGVDDNAVVYLNGTLVGQHSGWSTPFNLALDPAWITNGTNVLAVAVQNINGPGGISGAVYVKVGPTIQPPGISINQWLYLGDDNAPTDAASMTATNLSTSSWQTAAIGQDVFNGHMGYAWFRTTLDPLATSGRPLKLHFLCVDDNARIYLNGIPVGQHTGASQPFDILPLDYAWNNVGPNVLSVMVQNTGGPGGIVGPVSLECGNDIDPPGNPLTQWVWMADNSATNDAAVMTATSVNTSAWSAATIGQDVFNGQVGSAWFRSTLFNSNTNNPPVALHFLDVDDNSTVYLNGNLIGQHNGGGQAFDITTFTGWVAGSSNILAVAVQNTNGAGGILRPVLLQLAADSSQGQALPSFDDSSWRTVHVPHDYLIEGTYTNNVDEKHGYLPQPTAWYRKSFTLPSSVQCQSVWLDFDGVYHASQMWLNGHYLGYWYSGYASFRYDISAYMIPGGTNVLAVYVDPTIDEGWFYEGAGIYRHVWLNIANPLHIAPWGAFVTSTVQGPDASGNASANLTITTTITNATSQAQVCTLVSQVTGPDGVSPGTVTTPIVLAGDTSTNVVQTMSVTNARLWSLNTPQLYQLHTTIQQNNLTTDNLDSTFGIRSIYYDPNNGFFLNGQRVEIQGMCNHENLPGVGSGIPDNLFYWQVLKLKQSGVNAWRCSHNPPSPALLDACDRLGLLVMDENRNLGNSTGGYSAATTSTTFTDPSPLDSMILRDRNHPSVIMWSICNEEGISDTQIGADLFYAMKQSLLQFDTSRPITSADLSNPFNVGIPLVEDIMGFNYNNGDYDQFHSDFPLQPIFGSEDSSAAADRGEYTNTSVYATCYNSPEGSWQSVVQRPFIAGSFTWTGFDYKGEPGAAWPCVSSRFGILDICGLPKDMSYYYKACWGGQPLVHIFPHWNWSSGQSVAVWCYGNTASVELFLNGVSQGKQTMPAYGHLQWTVTFAAGTLLAKGYDANGNTIATNQVQTTGVPASIQLTTDRTNLIADGEDMTVVYASILDAQGRVVPTASNLVTFATSGAGNVVGTGNGDSTCHQPDHGPVRYAFNGWCLALTGATNSSGSLTLTVTSPGLASATLNLQALATNAPPGVPSSLSATVVNGQVQLTWPISFGATSYNIKRANTTGGPYTTLANYTAISYIDTTTVPGNTCYYMVSAVNTNGESANSIEVSVTPTLPAPLAVPTGLVALPDDGQVGLNWNTNSGVSGYNIKRSLAGAGPFVTVTNTSLNSYTDLGLTNGTTYYYVISALVNGSESSNSAPVSVTPVSMSYLVGTIIGTPGSWNNTGNTREMAMDWNINTYFDGPIGTNAWVGLDFGTNVANVISKIRFCPRATWASRLVGGMFQGANSADFSNAVTLFTITSPPTQGVMTSLLNTNLTTFRYVRYFSPPNGWGNVAEVEFYSPGPHISLASGTILGTTGNSATTDTNAFDDNITTYFDSASANGNWVGLDLGSTDTITAVRYCPRSGYDSVMVGGIFQGANTPNFSDASNLWTITNAPPDATLTAQANTNTDGFRYVRYLPPTGSYGDVAEVQFFTSSQVPSNLPVPAVPTGLTATPGVQEVGLSWNASSGAITYKVKRGMTSGGPYTNIINRTATVHMDSGLPYGIYYYVVSAVNAGGESANSTEASAILGCSSLSAPQDLAVTAGNGLLALVWSPVTNTSIISVNDPTSYNVLRGTSANGPFTLLAAQITANSYTDTAVSNQNIYYYEVQAVNSCGASPSSAAVSNSLAGLNILPTLAPIPNQTIIAGRMLLITNVAGDFLAPPQLLTFSLSAPAAGANINSSNGLFSWRPGIAQRGTTNFFTVVVSNNGLPSLGASQSFTASVQAPARPAFGTASVVGGNFQTWVSGDAGPDYSVYGSTNLIKWQLILTTNPVTLPFLFVDRSAANASKQFYQIQLGP